VLPNGVANDGASSSKRAIRFPTNRIRAGRRAASCVELVSSVVKVNGVALREFSAFGGKPRPRGLQA